MRGCPHENRRRSRPSRSAGQSDPAENLPRADPRRRRRACGRAPAGETEDRALYPLPPHQGAGGGRPRDPGSRGDHADLPRQLRSDAGAGGLSGRRMLHGKRRSYECQDGGIGRPVFSISISIFLVLSEDRMSEAKTVAIIGAGPVGLAAAAHVLERGLEPIVLEAGDHVGHAMRQWGHVQLFSPWEYNVDKAAERLLATSGWNSPEPDQYPTGAEMVERYLEPLAAHSALKPHVHTSSRVTGISRIGFDKLKTKSREAT